MSPEPLRNEVVDDGGTAQARASITQLLEGKKLRLHGDNKLDYGSILLVIMLVVGGIFLATRVAAIVNPPPRPNPFATAVNSVSVTASDNIGLSTMAALLNRATAVVVTNTITPVPATSTPSLTPTQTFTPAPTLTPSPTPFLPQYYIAVSVAWPIGAKAISKVDVTKVKINEKLAACPDEWPLGTEILRDNLPSYICVDRAHLRCRDAVCQIIVFSSSPEPIFQSAQLSYPSSIAGDAVRAGQTVGPAGGGTVPASVPAGG